MDSIPGRSQPAVEEDASEGWEDVEWEDNDLISGSCIDAYEEAERSRDIDSHDARPSDRVVASQSGHLDIFIRDSAADAPEASSSSSSATLLAKRGASHVSYSDEDRRAAESIHRSWLEQRLRAIIDMNAAARDEEVVAISLSLMPSETWEYLGPARGISKMDATLSAIGSVIAWISASFRLIDDSMLTEDEGRDGASHPSELLNVICNRAGSANQLNQILLAFLLALGMQVRYIATVDPPSSRPGAHAWIKKEARARKEEFKGGDPSCVDSASSSKVFSGGDGHEHPVMSWVEVLAAEREAHGNISSSTISEDKVVDLCEMDRSSTTGSAVGRGNCVRDDSLSINIRAASKESASKVIEIIDSDDEDKKEVNNSITSAVGASMSGYSWICASIKHPSVTNRPEALEACRVHKKAFVYIVAVNSSSVIVDVTARYAAYVPTDNAMKSKGYDKTLFRGLLEDISSDISPPPCEAQADADLTQRINELQAKLPNNLAGFINHPYFALEKQLQFDEVINPSKRKAVGVYKGIPVYPRSAVEKICAARVWRRLNRRIIEGEKPIKVRTIQRMSTSSSSSPQSLQKVSIPMFASWQTELIVRDVVNNGVLPLNEYGNIEIIDYNTSNIPIGSTYIQDECALQAAIKLGLPHAPAVVGFECKKSRMGKSHPIIDGVIVLTEHAALVREVATQLLSTKMDVLSKKLESKCASRWERLARGLLARKYVQETYGSNNESG